MDLNTGSTDGTDGTDHGTGGTEDGTEDGTGECPYGDGGDLCSGHGLCFEGQCQCTRGYYGVLCNSISRKDSVLLSGTMKDFKDSKEMKDVKEMKEVKDVKDVKDAKDVKDDLNEEEMNLGRSLLSLSEKNTPATVLKKNIHNINNKKKKKVRLDIE
jgi:hypothetical protein